MKKWLAALVVISVVFAFSITASATSVNNGHNNSFGVSDNYAQVKVNDTSGTIKYRAIVYFDNGVNAEIIKELYGVVNRIYKNIPATSADLPASAIMVLDKMPGVTVEPDVRVSLETQTQDWGLLNVNVPQAWSSNLTGSGVKVAVVDTGIAQHEDLDIAGGKTFVSGTISYNDDNGHGTHVAGIIGAENNDTGTVGVAYDAGLYAVKVMNANGEGYYSDIIAGIDWCISNKMDIVNLSLGGNAGSTSLKRIIDQAYSKGVLVVAAAGNDGTSNTRLDNVNYPARYSSAIAVAATDSSNQRASFSSTGSTVEVAAPGVSVLSTYPSNQYVYMSGTSMATPYTVGTLALYKQAYPNLSAAQLRSKLTRGALDLGTRGKDNIYGYGLIQAPVISTPQDPEDPEEDTTLRTVTDLSVGKDIYKKGSSVAVSVKVVDKDGKAIYRASVKLKIITPTGRTISYSMTTNRNGLASKSFITRSSAYPKGTYELNAISSYKTYETSSDTASFVLQ